MPLKQSRNTGSSSKKPKNVNQEDLKKMIKSMHKDMIKSESRICELIVDGEKRDVYIKMLTEKKNENQAKNSTIEQWKEYQEGLSNVTPEQFPEFPKYMAKHNEIWKTFYENYRPQKERTEDQVLKQKYRMERKWKKIKDSMFDRAVAQHLEVTSEEKERQGAHPVVSQEEHDDFGRMDAKFGKKMGADINLMSKMPSYLRPFSN